MALVLCAGGVWLLCRIAFGGGILGQEYVDVTLHWMALVLCAGGVWLLCRIAFGGGILGQEYVDVTLHWDGHTQRVLALRDTGNTLRDPITGAPVLVVSAQVGQRGQEYVDVTLHWDGHTQRVLALRDTGNTLRDPITGAPVLVVSAQVGQRLTGLTREQLAKPIETMAQRPIPGLRLIPYRAVGQSGGLLLGLSLERVCMDGRQIRAVE